MTPGGGDPTLAYYARRAPEYEAIYRRPERQAALGELEAFLARQLAGREVLEVACGTGYWTVRLAAVCRSILATDGSAEVLALARGKAYPEAAAVRFSVVDAWALEDLPEGFTGALAAFWWSHVPRARQRTFLDGLHRHLAPAARVVLCDNTFVPGSSTAIACTDAAGDTFQLRRLTDGSEHLVRKNFPDQAELAATPPPGATRVEVGTFTYFWALAYTLPWREASPVRGPQPRRRSPGPP